MNNLIQKIPFQTRNIFVLVATASVCMWLINPTNKIFNSLCIIFMYLLIVSINSYIALHFKVERRKRASGITQREKLIKIDGIMFTLFILAILACMGTACFAVGYIIDPNFIKNGSIIGVVGIGQFVFAFLILPFSKLGEYLGKKVGDNYPI